METFGRKLERAMERRGLRIEEVAQATGLEAGLLRALVRNDFGDLPGDSVMKEALASFARLVDVDPDRVIADFLEERRRDGEPLELEVVSEGRGLVSRRGLAIAAVSLVAVTTGSLAFLFWPSATSRPAPGVASALAGGRDAEVRADAQGSPNVPPADEVPPGAGSEPPASAGSEPPSGDGVSIPEHGIGRGVVDRELVGESDRFVEGEQVWFWNRIEGGIAGDEVVHVWLHEDVERLRVPIGIGGARWRTQSHKLLNAGSAGRWAVEARGEDGAVLARREFSCSAVD